MKLPEYVIIVGGIFIFSLLIISAVVIERHFTEISSLNYEILVETNDSKELTRFIRNCKIDDGYISHHDLRKIKKFQRKLNLERLKSKI